MKPLPNKIILASTFRHYFLGIAIALNDKDSQYHMVFIDQKFDDKRNLFLHAAKNHPFPFNMVSCLPTQGTGKNKRKVRLNSFSILKNLLHKLKPTEIFTGNDRRLEFQFSIQYAKKYISSNTIGSYIDDGTGSYIDAKQFHFTKFLADRYIDTFIKKIAYGSWYKHPLRLGQSPWIEKAYLTHPQLLENSGSPTCIQIQSQPYTSPEGLQTIKGIISELGVELPNVKGSSTLLVLPHNSLIKAIYGSVAAFKEQLIPLLENEKNILVKYHPRDLNDPYELQDISTLLPTTVPAEIFLVAMDINRVIGDISTTMMSAKWLNPNCKVEYIKSDSIYSALSDRLFESIGITQIAT